MKNRIASPLTDAQRQALEARLAQRIAARLDEGAGGLPHDVNERLRVAREQAVAGARAARARALGLTPATEPLTAATTVLAGAGSANAPLVGDWQEAGSARAAGRRSRQDEAPLSWGWRLASLLPLLALVIGLWAVHAYHAREQVEAAADIDTAILTDDLPPDAYADPGFEEFLRRDNGAPPRPIEMVIPEADGDLVSADTEAAEATP